ncbi:MAG: zinc ribbon domain-containing protein [Euryarchaeota archaeon]|nr:zinc ribbon domain-containing protein [Euryarchaeota archaeon]
MVTMNCPKCGAPFEYEPGMRFKKCDYCGTMIYIDKSRVMFYYIIPFSLNSQQATEVFRRWAAGSTKAKGLDAAQIKSIKKMYFPVYRFVRRINGREEDVIKPAKTTLLPGMSNLKIPPGDMRIFDDKYDTGDAEVIQPDTSMDAYLGNLPGEAKEQEIVYFPLYEIRYVFNGQEYNVLIDGSSGEVFSSYYPTRSSAPYLLLAVIAFVLAMAGAAGGVMISGVLWFLVLAGFLVGGIGGYFIAKKF